MRHVLVFALTLVVFVGPPLRAEDDGEGDPFATPIRALLAEDDAGLERGIYRGVSKGLEQAQLDKIGLDRLTETNAESVLARLEAEPSPLVFVIGRRAAELVQGRLEGTRRVFVDTAWDVTGNPLPPSPTPEPPAVVVRGVTSPSWVAWVLRAAFPDRPVGTLSWAFDRPELSAAAEELAVAAGFRLPRPGTDDEPQVLLHLRLGVGEEFGSGDAVLERARALGLPLVSDDLAHWGRGAAVLVLPDHFLLGRVAAEAGRRLLLAEEPAVTHQSVAVREVRVDLDAARDRGLQLRVPFLAEVDQLRGGKVRRPAGESDE